MKKSSKSEQKRPKKTGDSVFALILAGGQSSRLFPFNKIFSDLTDSGRTLLQQAYDRVTKKRSGSPALTSSDHFYALTNSEFISKIRAQLHLTAAHCLADPLRRGTWPALLWAMAHLRKKNPNAVIAVLSADHVISDEKAFRRAAAQAIQLADERPVIATIGVLPTHDPRAWLGYGALRVAPASIDGEKKGRPLQSFEEKPSLERAESMMKQRGWLWNAGMFFFRIPVAEEALHVYQPSMSRIYERITAAIAVGQSKEAAKIFEEFPKEIQHPLEPGRSVANTIDYAILSPLVSQPESGLSAWAATETLRRWMDVGEWEALRALIKPDRHGNTCIGRVRAGPQVRNCILAADASVALDVDGLSNMIVAFSAGRALIIPRSRASEVKQKVAESKGPLVAVDADSLDIRLSKTRLVIRPK